ncbi:MAG: tetratricopeptide repeat protein [Ginsengibacter sp.]
MNKTLLLIGLLLTGNLAIAQSLHTIDSLKIELANAREDTSKIDILINLNSNFWSSQSDSALKYGEEALRLAKLTSDLAREALALQRIGGTYGNLGNYPKSFEFYFKAMEINENISNPDQTINCLASIGTSYELSNNYPAALRYYQKALKRSIAQRPGWIPLLQKFIGIAYRKANQIDSAFFYMQKAITSNDTLKNAFLEQSLFTEMGIIQFKMGNRENAFHYVHQNISINENESDHRSLSTAYNTLADFFKAVGNADSGIYYAKRGLVEAEINSRKQEILQSYKLLAELYEPQDTRKALYYLKMASAINDELFGAQKTTDLQKTLAEEQERVRQAEVKRIAYENQLKQYTFLAVLFVIISIALLLYRNNVREKKAKKLLAEKNELIQQTLTNLKSTQTQLIHSEKMASLGELTAGIAHEIQNPLNFVNNFSEVNKELLAEMKNEIDNGNIDEVKSIANDVIENQEKINHHGKRADAIVKGMLLHSRQTSGTKEPTDINALCNEYLRLVYHGIKAKDKNFNADIKTDFDESFGKINIVPQDVGRVLLNLYNNSFYAVNEKLKAESSKLNADYKPLVSVQTKKINDKVEIRVKDNGNGIRQNIVDKIFQPFFTTKPTGQGTGLGLSLSYDIIKAQGGEIKVETKEGEGAEFIIQLPVF